MDEYAVLVVMDVIPGAEPFRRTEFTLLRIHADTESDACNAAVEIIKKDADPLDTTIVKAIMALLWDVMPEHYAYHYHK